MGATRRGMSSTRTGRAMSNPLELVPLSEVKRGYILRVLDACNGQRTAAAQVLRIDRKTLYRQLKRYGL